MPLTQYWKFSSLRSRNEEDHKKLCSLGLVFHSFFHLCVPLRTGRDKYVQASLLTEYPALRRVSQLVLDTTNYHLAFLQKKIRNRESNLALGENILCSPNLAV